ncbi:MAG: MurR/RpiR family transcriptional regulator [Synergistales bacterium]|nr:MurR/RpiR family transcriptional regulator [Synergistales bacterium]
MIEQDYNPFINSPQKTKLFEKLTEIYPHLSKQHRVIADAILQSSKEFPFVTAKDLGKQLGMSGSTIVRFAYKLGFSGYPDLQREIQRTINEENLPLKKLRDSFNASVNVSDLFDYVKNIDIENINNVFLAKQDISKTINLMARAGKVFIIAGRATFSLAHYLGFLLRQIDQRFVFFNSSSDYGFEQIASLTKNDLLIPISFNGYFRKTYELTRFAHLRSIPIVSVTDYRSSPLFPFSDVSLLIPNEAPFCSYAASMPVLNTLIVGFAKKTIETLKESFESNLRVLLENRTYMLDRSFYPDL